MNIIQRIFIFTVAIILTGLAFAEPTKSQLLEDINIKISSSQEIKVFLTFAESESSPVANVEKVNDDLKLSFNNSYVKLDAETISVNHELLKEISVVNINNKLNLIFKSAKNTAFTIKQKSNVYAISIISKDSLGRLTPEKSLTEDKGQSISKDTKQDTVQNTEKNSTLQSNDKVEMISETQVVAKSKDDDSKPATTLKSDKLAAEELADAKSEALKIKSKVARNGQKQIDLPLGIKNAPNLSNVQNQMDLQSITALKDDSNNNVVKFSAASVNKNDYQVEKFDFRLTDDKAAKIIVTFSNNNIAMVPDESSNHNNLLKFNFKNAKIQDSLTKKYDVLDFGTVVNNLNFVRDARTNDLVMNINSKSPADYLAYQKQNNLIIEVRDKADKRKNNVFSKEYSGRKISLNFQNIDLRTVLQIIADFTELNLVASDTVQGSISLRLMNVPWDQALDIILKTKNLDKRKFDNILMVAPSSEIFELEKAELESEKMVEGLIKLDTEYYPINYAKAEDIAQLISGKNKILSARGNASFDKRTNILIIQDTPNKLKEISGILKKLDSPVQQVLIEARLVRASTNFRKELGIRWGLSAKRTSNNYQIGVGDTSPNATKVLTDGTVVSPKTEVDLVGAPGDSGFNIDLGLADPSSVLGLALAKLPGKTLVNLELSALESEGLLQTISSPKLITANKVPARIEQGQEIPYQEATSSGAASVAFKKAVLSLVVTPQITPDNKIIMDLNVTNDTANFSQLQSLGVPVIDTQEVETQVLIDDGQTIVLGGIFTQTTNNSVEKVPFFGDLPLVGQLFRKNVSQDDRNEFLIFITPRIVVDKG